MKIAAKIFTYDDYKIGFDYGKKYFYEKRSNVEKKHEELKNSKVKVEYFLDFKDCFYDGWNEQANGMVDQKLRFISCVVAYFEYCGF